MRATRIWTAVGAGTLLVVSLSPPRTPTRPRPLPTEHRQDRDAEERHKAERKAWIAAMHKTPPGVDYKTVERANGMAQLARRTELALRREAPDVTERWVERGSDNQAGRMHAAAHSSDHGTLYAGSSLGGVWRGDLEGGSWEPIGDDLYGGAHWLAAFPPEVDGPDIVLAATDWGYVHRSADDGGSWVEPAGLGAGSTIRRLLVTSDGSYTGFIVRWTGSEYVLLRSTDAAASFEQVLSLGSYAGDLWAPRDGGSELFLVGGDGAVLVSEDLGDSWVEVGALGGSRAELTGSEAGAPTLYAVVDGATLQRSDDAGETWEQVQVLSDYWSALNASVGDPDLFAWGGVELHVTRDGGESFAVQNAWYDYYDHEADMLHADVMGVDVLVDADGSELWYVATDGGLYVSRDRLETVENLSLSGLRVGQYYDVLTSSADPDHVAAGAQDQGYQLTQGMRQDDDELWSFDQVISGDYGHLSSADGSHDFVFSMYPGMLLVQVGENSPYLGYGYPPEGASYAWLPPVVADPDQPEAAFFCANRLYRFERTSTYWWEPVEYGDRSFGPGYLTALAFSPLDSQLAWAVTNGGEIYLSADHGLTWTESDDSAPSAHYFYGTALLPSAFDRDLLYVGGSGYYDDAVYRSTDGGQTWEPWGEGLPSTLVYDLAEARDGSGRIFAGTETAAYMRDPSGEDEWVDITGSDAPVTAYWSVEALTAENTMRFGTYGRGIWDYQLDPDHVGCFPVQDYDGDGDDCDVDCDDHDASVGPSREDECDGEDVNCDGVSELDDDGDGWLACEECDDGNAGANPDGVEVCGNGVDEDCDGKDASCPEEGGRCGCAAGASPAAPLALWLFGAGALVRRRRC